MEKEQALRQEYEKLQAKLNDPTIYSSQDYPAMAKRQAELENIIDLYDKKNKFMLLVDESKKLASSNDIELAELAKTELIDLEAKVLVVEGELELALTPSDPKDEGNCIIEIRAAAGGNEASLFAGDLMRMYLRYSERHSFKTELVSESPNEQGGQKEVIFKIEGPGAYGQLKYEAGVHRVQRIPVTESSGRIHTSTVTVAVLPEATESEVIIKPEDVRIDVFRASGHGGQSVNTTDSAVRITHLPTGLVVSSQDEKSQIKNRAKGMGVLRSRLLALKMAEQQKELSQKRLSLIGSGERSEKIRTYNYPQDRITDHRINYSRSNLPSALDGEMDDLVSNLRLYERELAKSEV